MSSYLLTLICSVTAVPYSAWARLVIHSQAEVEIELLGFDTLAESSIFKGKLAADSKQEVETDYRGLALLVFTQGQTYPIILGDKPLTVQISNPGEPPTFVSSPDDLQLETSNQKITLNFGDIKGSKIIAFVSEQCPVSMVATVSKARILAKEKNPVTLIVAPLEKLSDKHLAMSRMLRNGKLLFVRDEKWRQGNLKKKIKLPLFISIKDERADLTNE